MSDKSIHVLFVHPEIRTQEPPNHPPYGMCQLAAITDEAGYKVALLDNNAFRLPIDGLRQEMKGDVQPKSYRFNDVDVQINPNGTFQVNTKKYLAQRGNAEPFAKKLAEESSRIQIHEAEWDIIAIGGLSTQYKYIQNIAKVAREEFPSALIVAGGGFLSSMPFDIMKWTPEFDIGCIGESYNTWRDVLQEVTEGKNWSKIKGLIYREGKKLKLSGMRPLIKEEDLDEEVPWPAYENSPVETYLKYSSIMFSPESLGLIPFNIGEGIRRLDVMSSLGCSWNCKFCYHVCGSPSSQAKLYHKKVDGKPFRQHSPKYVVNLIDHLRRHYGVNFVSFIDENFTTNKTWFYDFCAEMEQQDLASLIHWGVVGHSRTIDQEMLTKGRDVGMSYISYGGECLDPETYVFSSTGAPIQIQNLNSTLASVDFENDLSIKPMNATKTFKTNIQMLQLSTSHKKIKCSPEHKLFTLNNGAINEVSANELKIGDYVAVARKIPSNQPEIIGKEICKLIGFGIGDGYLCDKKPRFKFASSQPEMLEHYGEIAKKYFLSEKANPHIHKHTDKGYELTFYSLQFRKLIDSLNLNVNSPQKSLHQSLLSLSDEESCLLLRGLFDSDGGVCPNVGGGISFYSTSRKLVEQVKMLLLRLGIDSQNVRTKKYHKFEKDCTDYILTIKRYTDVQQFATLIGFTNKNRDEKLQALLSDIKIRKDANYRFKTRGDVIPMGPQFWKRLAKAYTGHWHGAFKRAGFGWESYTYAKKRLENPKRTTCLKLIAELEKIDSSSSELAVLKKIVLAENIGWERISTIKDAGETPIVYDFSVPSLNNYIANGFIVHNSGSQKILDSIGKGQTPAQMTSAIESTQAAQVTPVMSFIVGFPEETIDDVIATCQFFIDNGLHCDPFILQPYPGSAYYDEFKDKIIEQHLTPEEKDFIQNPGISAYADLAASWSTTGIPTDLPSKKTLATQTPILISKIKDDALKRWVLSLDDATKMSCNISKFSDLELAGLKYMLYHWDIERLKNFKKQYPSDMK